MFRRAPRRTVERMAGRAQQTRQAFLIEHYRPGFRADELSQGAARIREAVAELERDGKPVRYVRSTIVPGDEFFLCIVEASSEQLVREACARAGVPFERVSAAVTEEDPSHTKKEVSYVDPHEHS
jgi:hypothetical protein